MNAGIGAFFDAKYGAMMRTKPLDRFDKIPEIKLTGKEIDLFERGLSLREIRQAMPAWAVSHGVVGVFGNNDTGWDNVIVSRKSIKETMAHGAYREKVQAVAAIPDFIEHGVLLQSEPTKGNTRQTSHVFAARIMIAGKPMAVGYVVREDENGKRYYNHELAEIKNLDVLQGAVAPAPGAASSEGEVGRPVTHQGRIVSILRKYLVVKDK